MYRTTTCTDTDHGHPGALVYTDLTGSDPCPAKADRQRERIARVIAESAMEGPNDEGLTPGGWAKSPL